MVILLRQNQHFETLIQNADSERRLWAYYIYLIFQAQEGPDIL